jgi:uncharacterized membrane protein YecN with MAPEG domain
MTPVPVTLATAACATFLNIWLGWRIARLRNEYKVSVGDGGHEPLLRRIRAQANFIENAPFVLILLGGLELSGANRWALLAIAAIFVLARISHAIGMDAAEARRWRMYGMMGSAFTTVALAIWAIVCAAGTLLGR